MKTCPKFIIVYPGVARKDGGKKRHDVEEYERTCKHFVIPVSSPALALTFIRKTAHRARIEINQTPTRAKQKPNLLIYPTCRMKLTGLS